MLWVLFVFMHLPSGEIVPLKATFTSEEHCEAFLVEHREDERRAGIPDAAFRVYECKPEGR